MPDPVLVPTVRESGAARRSPLIGLSLFAACGLALGLLLRGGGPAEGRVVSVYSAHGQEALNALVPRFQAETGIRIELVKLGSGEVMQRVEAERGAPRCDVIWSVAGDQLAAHPELLAPHRPEPLWESIAPEHRQTVGAQPWLPYTLITPVLLVNTDLLPATARPQRWSDLSRADLKGRISSARADKSGSAFLQTVTILRCYGDEAEGEGWRLLDRLLESAILSGSSSAVPRLVNDGEAALGLTLEHGALRYVRGGGPVEIVYPADGTCAAPDGIALVAGAPHPAEAAEFVAWALSEPTQRFLSETLGRRAVRADVPPPAGLPALSEIEKLLPYDFAWAATRQEAILTRWRARVTALGK